MRYAPLTLTYLASLIPEELNINLKLLDEGVDTLNSLSFDDWSIEKAIWNIHSNMEVVMRKLEEK